MKQLNATNHQLVAICFWAASVKWVFWLKTAVLCADESGEAESFQ